MKDEDLRDLFAAFAMFACTGNAGDYDSDAQACYEAADAMIRAKYAEEEPEEPEAGITAIKRKRKATKEM
jgi:hypothetical protein